ncbi:ribose ABC transporter permease [Shinella daejeonensis]|uniref:ABC transporter permease subunit n=1 Tax=Shinella daejeonensis TaxID=659017 RepID=UPI0020C7D46A|nr:ribose ABC transporter permease [Shinella daejeonensis]MCP8894585.1 ribose ABC transporter permease [Shinella daejeonensis]
MQSQTQSLPPPAVQQQRVSSFVRAVGMLPILIILAIAFQLMSGYLLTGDFASAWGAGRVLSVQNVAIVAQQASINIVLAAGMTFVIITGGIDLSVGSVLAAAAMVGVLTSLDPGFGAFGTVTLALGVGLLLGLANGTLISVFNLQPFIVTLGALTAVRGLARLLGNDQTVFNRDLPFAVIGNGTFMGIPWMVVIALAVVVASWLVLRFTVLGVRIYAVGGNPKAARMSGIRVWQIILFTYGISGLLAGLGGVMSASRLYAANGLQLGQSYELDAIAAVILGGTRFIGGVGSIWGTLIGALIIAVLTNGLVLLGVSDVWQYIIKGFVIIGAVILDKLRQ